MISVVLPAYNEEDRIASAVSVVKDKLPESEVIIVEDGCSDQTPQISNRLASQYPSVKHLHSDLRLGKGRALTRGLIHSKGDVSLYMNIDIAVDPDTEIFDLIQPILEDEADLVIGTRKGDRLWKREIFSSVYNSLVRFLFDTGIPDHQCGYKAFSRKALSILLPEMVEPGWVWDTEVLVRAKRQGLRISVTGIQAKDEYETSMNLPWDALRMAFRLFLLRLRI